MNKFNIIKTIQLTAVIALTVAALLVIFLHREAYTMIASDPAVRVIALFLWIALGISFVFLYYDFHSFTSLRRENAELDNAVYSDALTGIANRYSVDIYLGQFQGKPLPEDMGAVTIDITNLSEINSAHGHAGGDAAIQAFSEILQQAASGVCFIGRNGGNKFVAIFRECSEKRIETFLKSIETLVDERNSAHPDAVIRYSIGKAFDEGGDVQTLNELIALSDRRAWQGR